MTALMKGEAVPQREGGKVDGRKIDPVNRGRTNREAEDDQKKKRMGAKWGRM